jgi:hypothetical protein
MRILSIVAVVALSGCGQKLDPAEGHALLHRYTEIMSTAAEHGSVEPVPSQLDAELARARALAADGRIPREFHERYRRLVDVSRAIVAPRPDDASRALGKAEIEAFIRDVKGPGAVVSLDGGLASLGPVLIDEVMRLHTMLDGPTNLD